MFKKIILISVFFVAILFNAKECQAQAVQTSIRAAAMEMGKALVGKNSDVFLSYMHPSMITLAGGRSQLKVITDSALTVFEKFGGRISKINYGTPSDVITYKGLLQAVLPQSTFLTSLIGDVEFSSSLIAISSDKGTTWKFIDTNLFGIRKVKEVMPDISSELKIPKAAPPKFTSAE
jgi:hypothetical protein